MLAAQNSRFDERMGINMKKYTGIFTAFLCIMLLLLTSCGKTEIKGDTATLYYIYGNTSIQQILTDEETQAVIEIFDGKKLYSDTPSGSFSESVSILIGGNFYQIATDGCGTIKDSDNDKYFTLSDKELLVIEKIFASYGGFFPCE